MQQDAFVALVAEESGTAPDAAERALRATLETLGRRLSLGVARRIARCLPPPARGWVVDGPAPECFDADEFVRRVAERTGVDAATAHRHARAGFAALARAADPATLAAMRAELPGDITDRLTVVSPRGVTRPERFMYGVAGRTGLHLDGARRSAHIVLEVLAERVNADAAEEVALRLPPEARPALARGRARSNGAARPLSRDAFVAAVAKREQVSPDAARGHARAVLTTLFELFGEDPTPGIAAQLPADFAPLLGPAFAR